MLPSDIIAFLVGVSTFWDMCTMIKLINNTFLRTVLSLNSFMMV